MSSFASKALLFTLMALSMGIYTATLGRHDQVELVSLVAIGLIFLSLLLERVWPYRKDWNGARGDVGGDVSSFFLVFAVLDGLLKWATPFLILLLIGKPSNALGDVPLWVEIICATLLIEFGAYWAHRLHHTIPELWALHAMHHSPKRLYTLNNFRFHPFNHVLNHALMIVPPLLLGFSPKALLGYVAFATPILLLQHSNINFRFGWLNTILNTNAVHRWHHSAIGMEGNCNYGRATLLWDHVFRTFYYPRADEAPGKLGIQERFSYPPANRFFDQLKYPFSRACCRWGLRI